MIALHLLAITPCGGGSWLNGLPCCDIPDRYFLGYLYLTYVPNPLRSVPLAYDALWLLCFHYILHTLDSLKAFLLSRFATVLMRRSPHTSCCLVNVLLVCCMFVVYYLCVLHSILLVCLHTPYSVQPYTVV